MVYQPVNFYNAMSKTIYWIIGIIIVVLAGIYFYLNSGSPIASTTPGGATAGNTISGQQSLAALFASGQSVQCTYTDTVNGQNIQGKVYVGGGKMRADTAMSIQGQPTNVHLVFDGATAYTWMDGLPSGSKFAMDPATMQASGNGQSGLDAQKKLNYNCTSWSVDSSLTTPPSSISFIDLSAVMPGGAGTTGGVGCSACDSLSGSAQAQCKAALKCP